MNRPTGRQRNVTGQGKPVARRGSGLGSGPVGSPRPGKAPGGYGERSAGGAAGTGGTRGIGGLGGGKLIIILLVLLLGGGGLGSFFLGGNGNTGTGMSATLASVLGNLGGGSVSTGWDNQDNTGVLDTSVAKGARTKYTQLKGNGQDEITIMLYICGTDLESKHKMASMDLQEMINAELSDKINLIAYTGGCKQWQNSSVSSKTNQIWQIRNEGMVCLEKDMGSKSMTDPKTLSSFIRYCEEHYPANRKALIFWDHGGGSVSGFGYDEKFSSSGSMDLGEIDQALKDGGVKFDFVGYDACLMATTENALMLSKYADYLIASEETEPGIGWYYTNWLTALSKNTSMPTIEIGQKIIDDFVDVCAQKCAGQPATLSIIDLAEAEATIPQALNLFAQDTCKLIENQDYAKVSDARSGSREFGSSGKIDQVDLIHLAKNMGTNAGNSLAEALLGAVKYNRTSTSMTNSYGLSIYFPYRKASTVDQAVDTYEEIGMDEDYARCIQTFASLEVGGQAASGGTGSPLTSLMGMLGGSGSSGGSDMVGQLLGSFLGGNVSSIAGLTGGNIGFLSDRSISQENMVSYISANYFDGSQLVWQSKGDTTVLHLPEEQWGLVHELYANMFFDDGTGFIDLGYDNVFDFDEDGDLLAPTEMTWIAVNNQPVAYYHESTVQSGSSYEILGRIPVLYNGERADLVVRFSDTDPYGCVVGVRKVYDQGETETAPKTMDGVKDGDVIDFVCDYYSYEGEYLDSYMLGQQLVVDGELTVSDVYVDKDAARLTYLFTDIYNRQYWTEPVK
ncbi:MAG: peptidase C11 [Oscillospiraceae bacterium]|nr:peptidase C11 [Oscillospiraceae bacterium]